MREYRDALTSEMKNAIKNVVAELLPILVARSLESDYSHGERSVDVDGEIYYYVLRLSCDLFVMKT